MEVFQGSNPFSPQKDQSVLDKALGQLA